MYLAFGLHSTSQQLFEIITIYFTAVKTWKMRLESYLTQLIQLLDGKAAIETHS